MADAPNPGMTPEVLDAIRRRSQTPQIQQVSPQARVANPVPPPPQDLNKASSPPNAPQPKFQPQTQDDLIVMALTEKLKNNDKLKKEETKMQIPQTPSPQAMGGGGMHTMPGGSMMPDNMMGSQPMPRTSMQSDYMGGGYTGLNNYGGRGI